MLWFLWDVIVCYGFVTECYDLSRFPPGNCEEQYGFTIEKSQCSAKLLAEIMKAVLLQDTDTKLMDWPNQFQFSFSSTPYAGQIEL